MFEEYIAIKKEMERVYLHDRRPWMIGYSGGKDSTLLCQLVFEMLEALPEEKRPSACIGCRSCEAVCPQQIKISEAMADFASRLEA